MFSSLPFGLMFLFVMGFGTMLSLSSVHWLAIWAGLEMNLIGFLPMLIYQKKISESESAVKYFIVQALGSSLLIFGSLLSFSTSFSWDVMSSSMSGILGLCALVSGLSVKLGMFPFHYWVPSVMAGLSWVSCMFLATWQKLAPLFLLLSLCELSEMKELLVLFCVMSGGSALVGGMGGLNQTQIRALLAYSSIGHLGWMTFAMLHSEWCMKLYLFIYLGITTSLFVSLWFMDSSAMKNVSSLKYFKIYYLVIMLLLLSISGLPPLLGFVSKWLVVFIASSGPFSFIIFMLILGSLMSLFYYLSLFFSFFLNSFKNNNSELDVVVSKSVVVTISMLNVVGSVLILLSNFVEGV
uniref:NADH-ubiquinone oxidoreductase chain 2 n=1 Tax=Conus maioensis TaxID=289039 RepID=A0A2H4UCA8_CONMH|nr:NADH dehydrogenase subunit 2 [Conus maioensis]ATZ69876.1 NADH dehydrogenase subunit 2 [Conus maioensis]ATZ69928.1 NADH dehydrogenase subunit 2 [Conus maioensis]ATZ69967.1 NADH dehydrogenase subunit 2 [Conus maioensis]ATZ70812.1 NADH dehydrogenase subunit 2 [Conus maioensis]